MEQRLHSIRLHFIELPPIGKAYFARCLMEPPFGQHEVGESLRRPRKEMILLPYDFIVVVLTDILKCMEPNIYQILRQNKFLLLEMSTILHGKIPPPEEKTDTKTENNVLSKLFVEPEGGYVLTKPSDEPSVAAV